MEDLFEKYKDITNGKQMKDRGIKPKTSRQSFSLAFYLRAKKLEELIRAEIEEDETMLGVWMPAFNKKIRKVRELTNPDDILRFGKTDMEFVGTKDYSNLEFKGVGGKIVDISGDHITVQPNKQIGNQEQYVVHPDYIKLIVPGGEINEGYTLNDLVVADDMLGHQVRFREELSKDRVRDKNGDIIRETITIPEHATGKFIRYQDNVVSITFDESIGKRKHLNFHESYLHDILESSSLGMKEPENKEEYIREKLFGKLFQKTKFNGARTKHIVKDILTGANQGRYGPPGSGKTLLNKDIETLAIAHEQIRFVEKDCKQQCNPYSIFDEEFSKITPPCPKCMKKYGGEEYEDTGNFKRPSPEKVEVKVVKYGPGFGIVKIEGSIGMQRYHMAGIKMPGGPSEDLLGTLETLAILGKATDVDPEVLAFLKQAYEKTGNEDYDPDGFTIGYLQQANNGILIIDEADKLQEKTRDALLNALDKQEVFPEGQRLPYPTDAFHIWTLNDKTKFKGALNDRMSLNAARYIKDPEIADQITLSSRYGLTNPVEEIDIGDIHIMPPLNLSGVPLPAIIRRAVATFYINFRKKQDSDAPLAEGNFELGSERSKNHAFDTSAVNILFDDLPYQETPHTNIIDEEYAIKGIQHAFCTRVVLNKPSEDKAEKQKLLNYVEDNFPDTLGREESAWWCNAIRKVAIYDTKIEGFQENFREEIAQYQEDPNSSWKPYQKVKASIKSPDNAKLAQEGPAKYPFMKHLFDDTPEFEVNKIQLKEIIQYYMESLERSPHELDKPNC